MVVGEGIGRLAREAVRGQIRSITEDHESEVALYGEGGGRIVEGAGRTRRRGGTALDLCCWNGRISVHLAKRGFRSVGVDFSRPYIEDARVKAARHGVAGSVKFVEGDVRKLKEILGDCEAQFDVVVSAWTSMGYTTCEDDLSTFRQARELSREGSLMFIIETEHEG